MVTEEIFKHEKYGYIRVTDGRYVLSKKGEKQKLRFDGGIPQSHIISAMVDCETIQEVNEKLDSFRKKFRDGRLRFLEESGQLVWGRKVHGTLVYFFSTQKVLDASKLIEDVTEKFDIFSEQYDPVQYEQVVGLKEDVRLYLKELGYPVKIKKSEGFDDSQQHFSEGYDLLKKENLKMKDELAEKEIENIRLQQQLDNSFLTVTPYERAVVDMVSSLPVGDNGLPLCPLCKSPMFLYQLSENSKENNRGRLVIKCTNEKYNEEYLKKNPNKKIQNAWKGDNRCQYQHPVNLPLFILFYQPIMKFIKDNISRFDVKHKHFLPTYFATEYQRFLESVDFYNQKLEEGGVYGDKD